MSTDRIERVFGRGRLRMITGAQVEVFREAAAPGEKRRYTKRFLVTPDGDYGEWTEREWRILARLIGHGARCVPDVVQVDRDMHGPMIVQTYDAGATVDQWATLMTVERDGRVRPNVFHDCAHWWALAHHCLVALDEIHAIGLVHLDVKADNVCIPVGPQAFDPHAPGMRLFPRFDRLALIDFAFSLVAGETLITALPIGWQRDHDYQSPRLLHALEAGRAGDLRPTEKLDWRCDFYSLAAMLKRHLPDDQRVHDPAAACGWTLPRFHAAKALVLALREVHDSAPGAERPHARLLALTASHFEDEALGHSLRVGWRLAPDAVCAVPSPVPLTPLTRIAPPLRPVTAGHDEDPMPAVFVTARGVPRPAPRPPRGRRWSAALLVGGAALIAFAGTQLFSDPDGVDADPLKALAQRLRSVASSEQAPAVAPEPAAPVRNAAPDAGPTARAADTSVDAAHDVPTPVGDAGASAVDDVARAPSSATATPAVAREAMPRSPSPSAAQPGASRSSTPRAASSREASRPVARAASAGRASTAKPTATRPTKSAAATLPAGRSPAGRVPPRTPAVARPSPAPVQVARAEPPRAPVPAAPAATPPHEALGAVQPGPPPPAAPRLAETPAAAAPLNVSGVPGSAPASPVAPAAPASPRTAVDVAVPGRAPIIDLSRPRDAVPAPMPMFPAPRRTGPEVSNDTARALVPPAVQTVPVPAPPSAVPRFVRDDDRYLAQGERALATLVPGAAAQARVHVDRVLGSAAVAHHPAADRTVFALAAARAAGDGAITAYDVAPREARRLHDDARRTYWSRGDAQAVLDLELKAFGADPNDAEIAGHLAYLYLQTRPMDAERARLLALHALGLRTPGYPAGRPDDWITFAVASALARRPVDATHAFYASVAVARDVGRVCRAALHALAMHGERLREPVDALLDRLEAQGRAGGQRQCERPPERLVEWRSQ